MNKKLDNLKFVGGCSQKQGEIRFGIDVGSGFGLIFRYPRIGPSHFSGTLQQIYHED